MDERADLEAAGPDAWIQRLSEAVRSGRPLDLRTDDAGDDGPESGASWGPERTIPGEAIATALLATPGERPRRRLTIRGARIPDALELDGMRVDVPLTFQSCSFGAAPRLETAEFVSLRFAECVLEQGLEARGMRVRGDLILGPNVSCLQRVALDGAHISGGVIFSGDFADEHVAISGDGVEVGDDLNCRTGFVALAAVRLLGARIAGDVTLTGGRFANPDGLAFVADRLAVEGSFFGEEGFVTQGELRLVNARIAGELALAGARLSNPGGDALVGDRLIARGGIFLSEGFHAEGGVRLLGSHIDGPLVLSGGHFANAGGRALSGDGMTATGGIVGANDFQIEGEARLIGARIGGHVSLINGRCTNPAGRALALDRTAIQGGLLLGEGFVAEGQVRLPGMRVESDVDLGGGRFVNPDEISVIADRIQVGGNIFCDERFVSEGQLRLLGAHVGGQMAFRGAIRTPSGEIAFDLEGAQIDHAVFLHPAAPLSGLVDLTNAKVGVLYDRPGAWKGGVELRGLRYDVLGESPRRRGSRRWRRDGVLHERLTWLAENRSGYHPQIYEQLAAQYRAAGHDARARVVLIHKQRRRRKEAPLPARLWSMVEDLLVGYGYRTWQAVLPWAVLLAAGTAFFSRHASDITQRNPAQTPSPFHAFTYTLDLLLPVINLGQRDTWVAHHAAQTLATVLILTGWVLTTAILAALTGLVRRPN